MLEPKETPERRAMAMLWHHLLERVAEALAGAEIRAVLIKGAALANTVYPRPAQRMMGDIDLLVAAEDVERTVHALLQAGFDPIPAAKDQRWLTRYAFDERKVVHRGGAGTWLVEVHSDLETISSRPVDYKGILSRAASLDALPHLRVPTTEDHVLLIGLHAAGTGFAHKKTWPDLSLLLQQPDLDCAVVVSRAKQWRLETAMYVALTTLASMDGAPTVAAALAEEFAPSRWRLSALRPWFDVDKVPLDTRSETSLPASLWAYRNTLLRDDLGRWLGGLSLFAAARLVEITLSRFRSPPERDSA